MSIEKGGVVVTGFISPTDTQDTYPTHKDKYGKGGIHSVATIVERDGITIERRSEGMLAYVASENTYYKLIGGLDNRSWQKFSFDLFCNEDYVLLGDENNIAVPSPILIDVRLDLIALRILLDKLRAISFITQRPSTLLPKAQALNSLVDGILKHTKGVVGIATPDVDYITYNTYQGDRTVIFDKLFNIEIKLPSLFDRLFNIEIKLPDIELNIGTLLDDIAEQLIFNSTIEGQISSLEASLTALQAEITELLTTIGAIQAELGALSLTVAGIQAELLALGATVAGLGASLAALEAEIGGLSAGLAAAGLAITALQLQMLTKASMSDISAAISALRLNNIAIDGDIDMHGYQLINLGEPLLPTNAATKAYVDYAIAHIPSGTTYINLFGDIIGSGASNLPIPTVFNVTRDFDVTDHKVVNVKDPEVETDATNLNCIWNLMHDEVSITWY